MRLTIEDVNYERFGISIGWIAGVFPGVRVAGLENQ